MMAMGNAAAAALESKGLQHTAGGLTDEGSTSHGLRRRAPRLNQAIMAWLGSSTSSAASLVRHCTRVAASLVRHGIRVYTGGVHDADFWL